jgi:hypothetical protein
MNAYKKRDPEEYGHPERDDDCFPDGQSFLPTDPTERKRLLKERLKGD